MSAPERTCVGCKGKDTQADLTRFVLVEGVLERDVSGTAGGRGAWAHHHCLAKATARKAWNRAFRTTRTIDLSNITPTAQV